MKPSLSFSLVAFVGLLQVGARPDARPEGKHPSVSFRQDIAPSLALSCSTRSCHGGNRPPQIDSHGDPAKMRAALIGVVAEERHGTCYVDPGNPDDSFLVQKIEGRLTPSECTDHDCGEAMPLDNPLLPLETRQAIRAWIAQGAKDN